MCFFQHWHWLVVERRWSGSLLGNRWQSQVLWRQNAHVSLLSLSFVFVFVCVIWIHTKLETHELIWCCVSRAFLQLWLRRYKWRRNVPCKFKNDFVVFYFHFRFIRLFVYFYLFISCSCRFFFETKLVSFYCAAHFHISFTRLKPILVWVPKRTQLVDLMEHCLPQCLSQQFGNRASTTQLQFIPTLCLPPQKSPKSNSSMLENITLWQINQLVKLIGLIDFF